SPVIAIAKNFRSGLFRPRSRAHPATVAWRKIAARPATGGLRGMFFNCSHRRPIMLWYVPPERLPYVGEVAMAKGKGAGSPRTGNKSAATGRFVSSRTVKARPNTTYRQTVKKK